MVLSKEVIMQKRFSGKKKGYDPAEVDAFLDEIVLELNKLQEERKAEQQEYVRLKQSEQSVAEAIVTAQRTAKEIVEHAQAEADQIIKSAQEEAADMRSNDSEEHRKLVEELAQLKQFVEEYKVSILKDMENQQNSFKNSFLSDARLNQIPAYSASCSEVASLEEGKPFEDEFFETKTFIPSEFSSFSQDVEQQNQDLPSEELQTEQSEDVAPALLEENAEKAMEELDCGDMATIDLEDIITGLPETDKDLKALIDEIM